MTCSIGRIIGTGIFSTPSSITSSVGSVGAALMLWVLGLLLSFSGLCVWLEFGCMFPRSGGEKVYLEAAYKHPQFLATVVFSTQTVILGFTGEGLLVLYYSGQKPKSEEKRPDRRHSIRMHCIRPEYPDCSQP